MRGKQTSSQLIERVRSMRKDGLSLGEIQQQTGISKSTISSYVSSIDISQDQRASITMRHRVAIIQSNQRRKGMYRKNRVERYPRWSAKLVECIAHFSFDGSVGRYATLYSNRSIALIDRQEQLVSKSFGLLPVRRIHPTGVIEIRYHSTDLAEAVAEYERTLVGMVENGSLQWQRTYLRAFFDDEGNIDVSRDGKRRRVRGYQHDRKILELVQKLLLRFDISSRIDPTTRAVVIQGSIGLENFQRSINFSPGIFMNHLRKNSRYLGPIEKRSLLKQAIKTKIVR